MIRKVYLTAARLIRRFGRPGVNNPAGETCRYCLHFGRFKLCQSEYAYPARPYSGDRLGIHSSVWIYTKKRALGFGSCVEWAHLMNIELDFGGGHRYSSESGSLRFHGGLKLPDVPPGQPHVTVRNTHKSVPATVSIVAYVEEEPTLETQGCATAWLPDIGAEASACFNAAPCLPTIGRVRYKTVPAQKTRITRLYGRPEWEA